MTHPIAKALEEAAEKIGTTLTKDASHAVADMYKQAGQGTEKVVKHIVDADDAHKKEIISLAEKIGKNHGDLGPGSKARVVQQADARSKIGQHFGVKGDYDAEVVMDKGRWPKSGEHIEEAQRGQIWRGDTSVQGRPKPSILTVDKDKEHHEDNRDDSLRGIPTRRPDDRDEYPPARFKEGGKGASVKYIPARDNQGSGSALGSAVRGLWDGARVKIRVK